MNKHDTSKSSLFLIELILSVFFFITAMAICLQLFVKAHTISKDTIALNQAVLWTQNLSELFLGNNGDYVAVQNAYSELDCTSYTLLSPKEHLLLLFDQNWKPVKEMASAFYLVLSEYSYDQDFAFEDIYVASLDSLADIQWKSYSHILATTPDALIHHIQVKKYIPQKEDYYVKE